MPSEITITNEHLIERARQQGIVLDVERAEALRPKVESLLARLSALGESLSRDDAPPGAVPPRAST